MTTRALPEVLSFIVDNRGRSCPTADAGLPLIATNCLKAGSREPVFENVRYVSDETRDSWFRSHPEPGDVLFVCKGSPGRVAVVPDPVTFCIAQDMVALRADRKQVDPAYLYYRLTSPEVQNDIGNLHVGTMIPHFKKGDFGKLRFQIHVSLAEQQGIAEVLGALDDKIAANTRAEEIAVDLIAALHRQAVAGVATRPLFDVFDVDFGEAFKGTEFSEVGVGRPLIRIRDLKTFQSQVWTTESRPRETIISAGDVVVGMDAEFRSTWWLGIEGLLNQRVCRVRGKETGRAFVGEALRVPLAAIESSKSGTTVIHLNKSDLVRSVVAYPDTGALVEFEAHAEPVLGARVALALERGRLAAMRDALLPMLMSGRVTVKDAESVVGEVL
ncbi:MAG TPA: restriction endonuclease subunit S [Tetrasphaera sp.]|nr:restriction endonuclease subunit S [Tetrasphaera sp.]